MLTNGDEACFVFPLLMDNIPDIDQLMEIFITQSSYWINYLDMFNEDTNNRLFSALRNVLNDKWSPSIIADMLGKPHAVSASLTNDSGKIRIKVQRAAMHKVRNPAPKDVTKAFIMSIACPIDEVTSQYQLVFDAVPHRNDIITAALQDLEEYNKEYSDFILELLYEIPNIPIGIDVLGGKVAYRTLRAKDDRNLIELILTMSLRHKLPVPPPPLAQHANN